MNEEINKSPLISVIVPIYNMEKLMRKCLDSIMAQTFQDYECLLIDDGSTDGSPDICDEYAAKDCRFKVFHKPNGGLSDARNYGLERAQGEYTLFFDPDDWVDEDCLTDMFAKAQETNADMVMCDLYYNDPYRQSYSKQEPTSLNHNDVLKDLITGKIYGFTVIKITYLPQAYYHYMFYGYNTLSKKYDDTTYQMDLYIRDMFVDLFDDKELKSLVYCRKSSSILSRAFMFGTHQFSSKEFRTTFHGYKKYVSGSMIERILIRLSLVGYYQPARKFFSFMYKTKQQIKKLCS